MNAHRSTARSTVTRSIAAASLGAALLLSACGGGSDSGASSANVGSAEVADGGAFSREAAPEDRSGAAGAAADTSVAPPAAPVVAPQMLARTASLSLQVKNLEDAAARVRAVATSAGGIIVSEKLASYDVASPEERTWGLFGTITLQVPADRLDAVLADLSKIGTVRDRGVSSEDVKTQVVDTESRLETMRESVARVRALMGQATKLSDVVALESELARRQADLEALQSQLASLKDRVAMSPVTVSLQRDGAPAPEEEPENAFLAGLRSGWAAFAGAVAVLLTVLGAVLPFALVAGLIGWPILVWLRRRRTAATPPAAPAAPAAQETAADPEPTPVP